MDDVENSTFERMIRTIDYVEKNDKNCCSVCEGTRQPKYYRSGKKIKENTMEKE